jgi:hypothetical protein
MRWIAPSDTNEGSQGEGIGRDVDIRDILFALPIWTSSVQGAAQRIRRRDTTRTLWGSILRREALPPKRQQRNDGKWHFCFRDNLKTSFPAVTSGWTTSTALETQPRRI